MTEDYDNFLITHAVHKAMSYEEIKQATEDEETYILWRWSAHTSGKHFLTMHLKESI